MQQVHTERNGGNSEQGLSRTTGLWMLLSAAAIAVSIVCYAVYNYFDSARTAELDELLLQEDNSELLTSKLSQERSSTFLYRYLNQMLAFVFMVVLGLCSMYLYSTKPDKNSWQATMSQKKQVFSKMYHHSRNLERQLHVSSNEMRAENLHHEAEKDSLQRSHEQKLLAAKKGYQEEMARHKNDYDKEINHLHSRTREALQQVEDLKQKHKRLEDELLHERSQRETLKAKLNKQEKKHKDKVTQRARDHEYKMQEWVKQKESFEHETTRLKNKVRQLEQRIKEWEEQCAHDKRKFDHRLQMCQKEWEQREREVNEKKQRYAANIKKEQEEHRLELKTQAASFKSKLDHTQRILDERLATETKKHTEDCDRLKNEMVEHRERYKQREEELEAVQASLTDELEQERKKHTQERMRLEAEVQDLQQKLSQQDTGMKAAVSRWFPWSHKKEATAPPTHSNNGATAMPLTDDDMRNPG